MNEYDKKALDFLNRYGVTCTIVKDGVAMDKYTHKCIWPKRWTYKVTIKRGNKSYAFKFTDCVFNYEHDLQPTVYQILATCEHYPVADTVEEFMNEFGYKDRHMATQIRKACAEQYAKLFDLFGVAGMNDLREIW